ncbi:hypothetical protein D3C77_638430 [compost metagenome]
MRLSGNYRNKLQLTGVFGQIIALLKTGDQILIRQLPRLAHRIHQLDRIETLPGFEVLENRDERCDAGPRSQ